MLTIIVAIFLTNFVRLGAIEIGCEKVARLDKYQNCCYLNATTVIDAANVMLSDIENPNVDAIWFQNNKKIQFLPVRIHKNFPNLETYLARNASVKSISALNFERLINLKFLNLRANEIEFVPNYCFEGLIRLEEIFLGKTLKFGNFNDLIFMEQMKTKSRQ